MHRPRFTPAKIRHKGFLQDIAIVLLGEAAPRIGSLNGPGSSKVVCHVSIREARPSMSFREFLGVFWEFFLFLFYLRADSATALQRALPAPIRGIPAVIHCAMSLEACSYSPYVLPRRYSHKWPSASA